MQCHEVHNFWNEFISVMNNKLPAKYRIILSSRIVIFGSMTARAIVNFFILVAKQFIVIQRARESSITLTAFRSFLQKMFLLEKHIAVKTQNVERFEDRWKHFVTEAGEFSL